MNQQRRNCGFSLTELLVVIAIIVLLTVIGLPSFKSYLIKSNAAALYTVLADFQTRVMNKYAIDGEWPDTITIPSKLFGENGDFTSGSGFLTWIGCTQNVEGRDGIFINGIFSAEDLGLPPNPNNIGNGTYGGTYFIRTAAFIDADGIMQTYCGRWHPDDVNDLPSEYMPNNCTYTHMEAASGCQIPTN